MTSVACIAGARPNFMKFKPVVDSPMKSASGREQSRWYADCSAASWDVRGDDCACSDNCSSSDAHTGKQNSPRAEIGLRLDRAVPTDRDTWCNRHEVTDVAIVTDRRVEVDVYMRANTDIRRDPRPSADDCCVADRYIRSDPGRWVDRRGWKRAAQLARNGVPTAWRPDRDVSGSRAGLVWAQHREALDLTPQVVIEESHHRQIGDVRKKRSDFPSEATSAEEENIHASRP